MGGPWRRTCRGEPPRRGRADPAIGGGGGAGPRSGGSRGRSGRCRTRAGRSSRPGDRASGLEPASIPRIGAQRDGRPARRTAQDYNAPQRNGHPIAPGTRRRVRQSTPMTTRRGGRPSQVRPRPPSTGRPAPVKARPARTGARSTRLPPQDRPRAGDRPPLPAPDGRRPSSPSGSVVLLVRQRRPRDDRRSRRPDVQRLRHRPDADARAERRRTRSPPTRRRSRRRTSRTRTRRRSISSGPIPADVVGQADTRIRIYLTIGKGDPGVAIEVPVGDIPALPRPRRGPEPGREHVHRDDRRRDRPRVGVVGRGHLHPRPDQAEDRPHRRRRRMRSSTARPPRSSARRRAGASMSIHNLTTNATVAGAADAERRVLDRDPDRDRLEQDRGHRHRPGRQRRIADRHRPSRHRQADRPTSTRRSTRSSDRACPNRSSSRSRSPIRTARRSRARSVTFTLAVPGRARDHLVDADDLEHRPGDVHDDDPEGRDARASARSRPSSRRRTSATRPTGP